ncbi:MAG: MBL fold metallo-hydrolase [Lachnospiraceae bacterium]|nr:MBL fold metallo-hydrolase [Lachnospiraceae bacterium]
MKHREYWIVLLICVVLLLAFLILQQFAEKQKPERQGLNITFLETGKSDCVLIQSDDFVIVQDTADADDFTKIRQTLQENGIEQIDYLLLSHYDKDHIGSAANIIRQFHVKQVFGPDYSENSEYYQNLEDAVHATETPFEKLTADRNIAVEGGSVKLSVSKQTAYKNENNYSMITSFYYGDESFLFMGDALGKRTEEFSQIADPAYDLIKLPHHGDCYDALLDFVEHTTFSYGVICAADNSTIEPELVQKLKEKGVKILYTYNGDVTLSVPTKESENGELQLT